MSKIFPENLKIHVTKDDIDEGKCGLPNKCMIKLAVKRAIGGHGYVAVDSTGIAITRRSDYREKAFLPRPVVEAMYLFDQDKSKVKPFSFTAHFFKTSKIARPETEGALERKRARRKRLRAQGKDPDFGGKRNNIRQRIVGLAVPTPKRKAA